MALLEFLPFKIHHKKNQQDEPLTICVECNNCYIYTPTNDEKPIVHLCVKFPLQMKTNVVTGEQYYVDNGIATARPYKLCGLINNGHCPHFEKKE